MFMFFLSIVSLRFILVFVHIVAFCPNFSEQERTWMSVGGGLELKEKINQNKRSGPCQGGTGVRTTKSMEYCQLHLDLS